MKRIKDLNTTFAEKFGPKTTQQFFAPGRINLIGEHTDYNGGHVFPASITYGTYGVAAKRNDAKIFLYSMNFSTEGVIQVDMDHLEYNPNHGWANYVKGMIKKLQEQGYYFENGFDLLVQGNIPNGAGLSSSASLELLVGVMLADLYQLEVNRLDLVETGQKVENEYFGLHTGIMDQFAIGFGKADEAILLDVNTMKYEMVHVELGEYAIVIMNTNKRRELSDSKYNERRSECEEALHRLQNGGVEIDSLGQLSNSEFDKYQDLIGDEILIKRARHAVYENQRTIDAKRELSAGNLAAFGKLLDASHASLRDDYEVTGLELDTLVSSAQGQQGVLGARMTGAGFGGCAIALVKESAITNFENNVYDDYLKIVGYTPEFYVAHIGDGAIKLTY
ncbi:galactokinase [Weissella coleopterorum]|uniref:Galactokinase n=1 Tax=Weissella coleopterorum TaxID=2714949 RepID=A0A6G8AZU0_9LACO|nr:galactokinase [Weissella coleopterorum]QIL50500.1 galactokinase [Weissella coleopterorum]